MPKVAVTGGQGTMGTGITRELLARGFEVIVLDRHDGGGKYAGEQGVDARVIDLKDYAAVEDAFSGCEAVIHMAAIPDPNNYGPHVFIENTTTNYYVFEAAAFHNIRKVVQASSESAYGFPWARKPLSPYFVPIDETHPLIPEDCYGISKAANELVGEAFHRRTGMQVVTMRLSSILTDAGYREFYHLLDTPEVFKRVFWSYVDVRDAVAACLLAIEKDGLGAVSLNIAADDTFQIRTTRDLLQTYFPEVTDIRAAYNGFEAFYSNELAKKLLGWQPKYCWREVLGHSE
ncbi:nucleoside-diphosphate-sugar epimerase [Paenibacillus baekrokdamisoli]|uniref:Nucleoside-diphosphate-sugar epimerase n=1 Tax=Paenibacillus baekrokdamisoli TaxID=1712516 RepID=A0A3G9IUQ9_9BACL|nr:NAD(P)-dependent oxidoreductase [Paenibacillus baekrokdamisoli]MBB3070905.1 nucleoside-diphosphate-sugar epimerase [Paenibacillus baekrokdamisoli]BBH22156.1 nucleoside-diphosphate-sugar epimerase [Paenibacillus baekrokdamisoli]